MKDLKNKVVWITGGGSGLGKAMALEFAKKGSFVVVSGRRKERLEMVVQEIQKQGGKVICLACDVTLEKEVKETVEKILEHFDRLDIAIANAGFGVSRRIEDLTLSDWRRQYETNIFGLVSTIQYSLPELKKTKGRMVLIGSALGCFSIPSCAPYQSTKYAVRAIGQTLSMELYGSGVSCTTIQPGLVKSEISRVDNQGVFQKNSPSQYSWFHWSSEKAGRLMVKVIYQRKKEVIFTGHGRLAVFLGKHFPRLLYWLLARFYPKEGKD